MVLPFRNSAESKIKEHEHDLVFYCALTEVDLVFDLGIILLKLSLGLINEQDREVPGLLSMQISSLVCE